MKYDSIEFGKRKNWQKLPTTPINRKQAKTMLAKMRDEWFLSVAESEDVPFDSTIEQGLGGSLCNWIDDVLSIAGEDADDTVTGWATILTNISTIQYRLSLISQLVSNVLACDPPHELGQN
jgi:hypothetical protein